MRSYVKVKDGAVGYGVTEDEAENDLKINLCKLDIMRDESGYFLERRKALTPWMPKSNMLHITDKGCLVYKDGKIVNTKNGLTVLCTKPYKSIFYYLAELFDSTMSYVDFMVVCRPEIDKFFGNISPEIELLRDVEPLKRLGTYTGFDPNVVYMLSNNLMLAKTGDAIGLKLYGEELFVVKENTVDLESLAYIGYRLGYHITKGGVEECQES